MTRFIVCAYLESFFTKDTGDIGGKGEFYFKCNGKRYPDIGEIQLGKNQTFDPEPNPVFYTALVDAGKKEVKFDVEVWEADPGRDDKFIDKEFKLPLKTMNETVVLSDKKNRCQVKIVVKMEEAKNW